MRSFLIGAAAATWVGCGWLPLLSWLPGTQSTRSEGVENDIARGVTLVGSPLYHLVVAGDEGNDLSRLMVLYVRVDSVASEPFALRPGEITLVHDDGTIGVVLERDQTTALLERSDLEIIQADPAARDPSGYDRLPEVQQSMRKMILSELLVNAEVRTDQPARGYLVVDLRRAQSTLDASTLHLPLTRLTDGARLWQSFRFSPAGVAGIETGATSSH